MDKIYVAAVAQKVITEISRFGIGIHIGCPQASDLKEMHCELTLFSGQIVFQGETTMKID